MADTNYPPLPGNAFYHYLVGEPETSCATYTADQMRAYVDADRAARAAQAEPAVDAGDIAMLIAAARSGDPGTIKLATILAGVSPCDACGYVKTHCRCAAAPSPAVAAAVEPTLTKSQVERLLRDRSFNFGGAGLVLLSTVREKFDAAFAATPPAPVAALPGWQLPEVAAALISINSAIHRIKRGDGRAALDPLEKARTVLDTIPAAASPAAPAHPPAAPQALSDEQIIRTAVAAMPHTNPGVADDLLDGFTMHTEAEDIVAIWKAAAGINSIPGDAQCPATFSRAPTTSW